METSVLRRRAYRLILLLGLVSLFGDITYEGVRGVTGPYLALLGASATVVGLVAGLGEFLGYAFRTVAGYIADRFRSHWLLTVVGYALVGALPLLAFTRRWELAAALIVLERLGKALRTPSRDAIVSHAASQVGRGKGFAIHEALDQVGALIGPLLFAAALTIDGVAGYRLGFALLTIPATAAVLTLLLAWRQEPTPEHLEEPGRWRTSRGQDGRLSGAFWRYTVFSALATLGFAPFALLAYHVDQTKVVQPAVIPLLYALAMGIDGVIALLAGWMYDRYGLVTLAAVPVCTALAVTAAFQVSAPSIVAGVVLWGAVMGMVETTMRAAVGELSAAETRGLAFGIFNTIFGLSWLSGGILLGGLYQQYQQGGVIVAAVFLEVLALVAFFVLGVARAHRLDRQKLAK